MNKPTFPTALLLAMAAASPLLAQAQAGGRPAAPAAAPRTSGRISGTITDATTGKPVSYATVNVINPATNSPVNGGVAGDDGKFVLPVPAGTYRIEVSFIGYTTQVRNGVTVPATGGNVALGTLALAAAAQKLGEVVVTGKKPLIEERVDRTIYNADVDKTTAGGDATDVLKRVPLLSVDLDGNVSLRGSQNIRVLINNKPSTIAASSVADALKQIPADQIQTVEVITSPSAKYDAEGSGGIINIVTKTNNLKGGSLGINTGVGNRGTNLGLNGNYRNNKFGISLGGFGRASYNQPGSFENSQTSVALASSTIPATSTTPARTINAGDRTTTAQNADTRRNDAFGRYTLGLTYDFDKHNSLAGSLAYGVRNSDNYQDGLLTRTALRNDPLTPSTLRDVVSTNNSNTVDASLNFTHTYQTEQRELSVLTLFSRNNQTNNFTNSVFDPSDLSKSKYQGQLGNNNDSYNEEYTGQLDYQTPTVKNQLLELGAKDIVRRVNSDYSYFYDASQAPAAGSPSLNNSFRYRQNVAAAYATYTIGLPKGFTVKPGVRYEYTSISADFTNGAGVNTQPDIPNYYIVAPSINLSRKLENGNVLKLSYNLRIQRPSLQFLNPNVQASNPLNASAGNPELRPEKTNNFELGYSTTVKQKVNLNLTAFVRSTNNAIQTVRVPLPDSLNPNRIQGALLSTFRNAGTENAYGGSLFAGSNTGKLSLNGSVDVYYAVLRNNDDSKLYNSSNQGFVVNARAFGSYDLGKSYSLQLFGFYRGQQVQLQGTQSGFGIYSLSLQKSFAEKRGSIGFGAENFFTGSINIRTNVATPYVDSYAYNGVNVPINGPVLSQNSSNVIHNLNFKINFSYRIGKLTAGDTGRRGKGVNNDDLKEGGDAGGGIGGGEMGGGAGAGGAGGAGGARPAGGQRPGGYPGAGQRPAGVRPAGADSTRRAIPADSLQQLRNQSAQPTGNPGTPASAAPGSTAPASPALAAPTQQPADSSATKPAASPAVKPGSTTSPVGPPSPGTTSPSGITPAGSPGGRP
ncbi:TonB-dependent receptor domain-containing protein [Hymenobacter cheonanensis]|uniref:TonB-dependent receptor domain-containing protein n=1 Tax=Hymenobacter sp. CA2-7 TaxID=3063993 RepID=UPI00271333B3|nr:TonB-dependent receptor [Hymenobacter sp. CA2-7]MDO7884506.1 TonB-dependent receptor [Hymenobacter sp. CA2-7]